MSFRETQILRENFLTTFEETRTCREYFFEKLKRKMDLQQIFIKILQKNVDFYKIFIKVLQRNEDFQGIFFRKIYFQGSSQENLKKKSQGNTFKVKRQSLQTYSLSLIFQGRFLTILFCHHPEFQVNIDCIVIQSSHEEGTLPQ